MAATAKKIHESQVLGANNLIYVTVGLHKQGFERLIKKMDDIAGELNEEVVMQIGNTRYIPKNAIYFRFTTEDVDKFYKEARVIVSHGGAGAIITALQYGKPIICVPRLQRNESMFLHQIDLVQQLEKEGVLEAVYDISELPRVLKKNCNTNISYQSTRNQLVGALRVYLDNIKKASTGRQENKTAEK